MKRFQSRRGEEPSSPRRNHLRGLGAGGMFGAVLAGVSMFAGTASADTLTYENARFGTTVTFPAHVFRQAMEPPPRGEGMTFLSADGASMAVFAMNNALDETPETLALQSDSGTEADGRVTYSRVSDDWVVVSGFEGEEIFYKRFEFGNDNIIHGLLIKYPSSRRDVYDALIGDIAESFDGP